MSTEKPISQSTGDAGIKMVGHTAGEHFGTNEKAQPRIKNTLRDLILPTTGDASQS